MSAKLPPETLHEEAYTVRTYEIDHQKRMTIPALVRLMQEAAMQHVLQLKLSVWDLETERVAWVLMRLQLEVKRLPRLEETITIRTCPTGLERILTYRNFWIYDAEGTLIAEAVTHWVLMDTQTRRLKAIPEWIETRFSQLIPETHDGLQPSRHKLPPLSQHDRQKSFHVRWHDLDFNLHLNNTYYILYLLEGLPASWLSDRTLIRLDIAYKSEVRMEESFEVQMQQLSSGQFLHRMTQGAEERVLAEMVSEWK
ncbi:acyl-[acyl-carrier-protein] thioesterase [Flavilitoribacter nigricans]|uniref:Acyl-ACP thioesterase n=1 Tax=Flavilitoribacter nigricans (strain ATCC 23147 / DSM 23189 / NBRC 102662 / NCIMB 1420 / SS-2) TaxID=1122177 RepID=A0A2D0N7R9_FLAN2|nr:acyl-ACP thioesterase domain-containing protein [Flavilitoribacter nigricans]PHN04517.1 hypothetical protein CRP01_21160 [Flavilitoribacter nigricans DSM 23189 = NBRC 102662]